MRRILAIIGAAIGGIVASYLAWCQTAEGKRCGKFVKDELAHYRRVKALEHRVPDAPPVEWTRL